MQAARHASFSKVRMWLSQPGDEQGLKPMRDLDWSANTNPPSSDCAKVHINPKVTFQTHIGLGGAFTESAAYNWHQLSPALREEALRAYFCAPLEGGHGYNLCRVHMNSCDFSLGHYAHVEQEGDVALESFSIARDEQYILPMIRAAQRISAQPLQIVASPWSPPAWMKSNAQMSHGGQLKPEYARAWAMCFVRFIQAYAASGVPIWGVTVQNEPQATQVWDSCIYSAQQERDFIRDHLGPCLHEHGLAHIHIIGWDHNRDQLVERASALYADSLAAQYLWGMGFHWYGQDHFEQVQQVHDAWPDKHLIFTEGCQEKGPHLGEWSLAQRYIRSLIHDLNHWCEGWIDWNLFLDLQGGPNHVGNFCSAPIHIDAASQTLIYQSSYWAMGHISRFVQPGARRILAVSGEQEILSTAFINPNGEAVVVLSNSSQSPKTVSLNLGEASAYFDLPEQSFCSLLINKSFLTSLN